jgi:hypothetical protein
MIQSFLLTILLSYVFAIQFPKSICAKRRKKKCDNSWQRAPKRSVIIKLNFWDFLWGLRSQFVSVQIVNKLSITLPKYLKVLIGKTTKRSFDEWMLKRKKKSVNSICRSRFFLFSSTLWIFVKKKGSADWMVDPFFWSAN